MYEVKRGGFGTLAFSIDNNPSDVLSLLRAVVIAREVRVNDQLRDAHYTKFGCEMRRFGAGRMLLESLRKPAFTEPLFATEARA